MNTFTPKIIRRQALKACTCRGCHKNQPAKTEIIYTYSDTGQGHHIYFCLTCARKIGNLATGRKRALKPS